MNSCLFATAGFSTQRNESGSPHTAPSDFAKVIVTLFLSSRNFFVLLLFSSLTRLKKCKRCPWRLIGKKATQMLQQRESQTHKVHFGFWLSVPRRTNGSLSTPLALHLYASRLPRTLTVGLKAWNKKNEVWMKFAFSLTQEWWTELKKMFRSIPYCTLLLIYFGI